jgi:hypothetical protein
MLDAKLPSVPYGSPTARAVKFLQIFLQTSVILL